jgi:hypothetical protein
MKPARLFHCEACDEAVSLPADLETIPRCIHCGRDSLVLSLDAPANEVPIKPEKAVELFKTMRAQVFD